MKCALFSQSWTTLREILISAATVFSSLPGLAASNWSGLGVFAGECGHGRPATYLFSGLSVGSGSGTVYLPALGVGTGFGAGQAARAGRHGRCRSTGSASLLAVVALRQVEGEVAAGGPRGRKQPYPAQPCNTSQAESRAWWLWPPGLADEGLRRVIPRP